MKYDVFISYSREDKAVADSLCHALDKAGISYWIDRNIHGSANFLSEITQYIRRCKVVVFIASSHSASSEWTQKEILFARKHHKTIVPYRIGDFRFDDNDELDFVFINVQWIESEAEVIEALQKLGCEDQGRKEKEALLAQLREECQALKKAEDIARTEFEKARLLYSEAEKQRKEKEREIERLWEELNPNKPVAGTSSEQPVSAHTEAEPTYQVGDYYNRNGIRGVVFEVSDGGRHGKIVSLDETETYWCTSSQYGKNITTGASSDSNGKSNTDKILSRSDRDEYPAFMWCRNKGSNWYLPSKEELLTMYRNEDKINATLSKQGGTKLDEWYWSSTEYGKSSGWNAWYVIMNNGLSDLNYKASSIIYVRAAAAF